MTDFEKAFATRLQDAVDAETDRVPMPRFVPPTERSAEIVPLDSRRRRTAWLVAAAAVAVVALSAAGILSTKYLSGSQGVPAGPVTTPAVAPTSSAPSGPTERATATSTAALAGANLYIPLGWVVTQADATNSAADHVWCFDPAGQSGQCTVTLSEVEPATAAQNGLDVDTQGGWLSNPSFCSAPDVPGPDSLDVADIRPLGGRDAEHRVWTLGCSGRTIHVEQYEVAYAPAWILYSQLADSTVSAAMATIAQNSTLTPQTLPLRLTDYGDVVSEKTTTTGLDITIARQYVDPSQPSGVIDAHATASYTVPSSVLGQSSPTVNGRVRITTDGTAVTQLAIVGG